MLDSSLNKSRDDTRGLPSADILVIEDDLRHLKYLTELLTRHGYRVRASRTGKSGLRAARLQCPNLILLDIRLPNEDGLTICRLLKHDIQLCDVPVIFISGLTDVESQIQGFAAGARDYITKPFEEVVILARIQNQLQIQQFQQQQKAYVQLQERHRIARELHDSVSQTLFILGSTAQTMVVVDEGLSAPLSEKLHSLYQLSQTALAEMRMLLFEIYPDSLMNTSFSDLLSRLTHAFGARTDAEFIIHVQDDDASLDRNIERKVAVYRIVQEGVFNAVRYANAKHISVQLICSMYEGSLLIEDDGVGFDALRTQGMGITNMRERAAEANLQFSIESVANAGTRIRLGWQTEK